MKSAIVIPARLQSTRLPRKLLLNETGMALIEHTWRAAGTSNLADQVLVATDSDEIFEAVKSFGGQPVMTAVEHQSGSDRVAEAAQDLDADIIINLQGDEPEVKGSDIDRLIERLSSDEQIEVATLATPINTKKQLLDPSCVKVVLDKNGHALYFSRSPIPSVKDPLKLDTYFQSMANIEHAGEAPVKEAPVFLQHLGIYGYRKACLSQLSNLEPSPLEDFESLEQLRFLANGWKLGVEIVAQAANGIDTIEDYAAFVNRMKKS